MVLGQLWLQVRPTLWTFLGTVSSFSSSDPRCCWNHNFYLWYFFSQSWGHGDPQKALNTGEFVSSGLMIAASYYIINKFLPETWTLPGQPSPQWVYFGQPLLVLLLVLHRNYHGHYTALTKSQLLRLLTNP